MSALRSALTRRTIVTTSVVGLGLAAFAPKVSAQSRPHGATPRGRGSVAGAPHLPAGFRDAFASRYVDSNGVRLHAVIGGSGPPLLLVHGWPQTWYQWRLMMPALAANFTVVAVDQRGIGLSDKPDGGYDAGNQANDLAGLMQALGFARFALLGLDTGMPISYALAADYPDCVARLIVGEAVIPGVGPTAPLLMPGALNQRLWHIAFNRLNADVNEALIRGRESIYFGSEFAVAAGTPLPHDAVRYYVEQLRSDDRALHGSFGWYRALDVDIRMNARRMARKITVPVLGVGGARSTGEGPANIMRLLADNVQSHIVEEAGHWIAEEQPERLLAAVQAFLAPYRTEML